MFTVSTVAEQSATTCSGLVNFVRWRPTMDTTGSLIVEPQECRAAYAGPGFHTMEAPPPSRRSIMLSTRVRAAASVPLSQCGGALACAAAVTSFASAAFRASSMPEAPAHSIDCRSRETCSFWWKIKSNNADRLNEQSAVPSARYADTSLNNTSVSERVLFAPTTRTKEKPRFRPRRYTVPYVVGSCRAPTPHACAETGDRRRHAPPRGPRSAVHGPAPP